MELKELLLTDIENEHEYLSDLEIGSEEYNASMKRLNILEDKLFDLQKLEAESESKKEQMRLERHKIQVESESKKEQFEEEKKDRQIKTILECVKIGSSIVVPLIGLVWITAAEKEITFCGALKGYASLFVPKKIF